MARLGGGGEGVGEYPLVPQAEQARLAAVRAVARFEQGLLLCHDKPCVRCGHGERWPQYALPQ